MKKFIPIVLMLVYGSTSMAAGVVLHYCNDKLSPAPATYLSEKCSHKLVSPSSGCDRQNLSDCTIAAADNSFEVVSFQSFILYTAVPALPVFNMHPQLSANKFILEGVDAPDVLHKIRLHLYNRVLLI